jgi:hypothetical protein
MLKTFDPFKIINAYPRPENPFSSCAGRFPVFLSSLVAVQGVWSEELVSSPFFLSSSVLPLFFPSDPSVDPYRRKEELIFYFMGEILLFTPPEVFTLEGFSLHLLD